MHSSTRWVAATTVAVGLAAATLAAALSSTTDDRSARQTPRLTTVADRPDNAGGPADTPAAPDAGAAEAPAQPRTADATVRPSNAAGADAASQQDDSAEAPSIAVVDTLRIVRALMAQDEYEQKRQSLRDDLTPQVQDLRQRTQQLATELQNMEPDDPNLQQKQSEYQQTLQRFRQQAQDAQTRLDQLSARQALNAFRNIRDEAESMAGELGYSHVITATARYDEMGASTTNTAMQEILARQMLVWPDGDDITTRLMDRLGVEDPPSPDETPGDQPGGLMPAPNPTGQGQGTGPGRPTDSGQDQDGGTGNGNTGSGGGGG